MADDSGIKGIEEQDLGTVEVNPNAQNKPSAFPQFTDEAKVSRGLEDFTKFKKGFKQALPYVAQLGADLVPGSGITEISGQQIDVVEGGKRLSFPKQVERTTELAKEGKTTEAIVSGVDTLLTGAAGVGEGMMVAGAVLPSVYGKALSIAGWGFYGLSKTGSAILRNTKTGKKILADFEGDDAVGYDIKSIKIPENVESDDTIKTLEDNIDIETVRTDDTDTEVAIPENIKDLNSTEAITSYVIAPEDVNRNQLIAKIENDPEVKTKTDKYLEEKGFTEETVPVFRLITPNKKGAEIGEESLISGSLTPESNIATMRYFEGRGGGQKQLVRYDVPKNKIKLAMGGVKNDIKQSSNKIIKEKKIGQTEPKRTMADVRAEAMGGGRLSSKVTNPSKTAKELIDMQDEVIADVTGLKKNVYEGNYNEILANDVVENITKGKYKNYEQMQSDLPSNRDFTTSKDVDDLFSKKVTYEQFKKIKDDRAKETFDKVKNFYKLGAPKQDEGIKALGPQDIKEKGITQIPTTNLEVTPIRGLDIVQKTDETPLINKQGKIKIVDIHEYLDNPQKKDVLNQKDFDDMIQEAKEEIMYQLKQEKTGKDWYDGDIEKTMKLLEEDNSNFYAGGEKKDLLVFLTSIMSSGQNVGYDMNVALRIMDKYIETGTIYPRNPDKFYTKKEAKKYKKRGQPSIEGTPKAWTQQTNDKALSFTDAFIKDQGLTAFLDFVHAPTTRREASKLAEKYGLKPFLGRKDEPIIGANLFGDKIGNFMQNMMGMDTDANVADIWFTRMMNRRQGNMFIVPKTGKNKGKRISIDQPQSVPHREAYDRFIDVLSKEMGESKRDTQAILWYFEQGLYSKLGVPSEPKKYSEVVEGILKQRRDDAGRSVSQSNEITQQKKSTSKTSRAKTKTTKLKRAEGGFVERTDYDWSYLNG